MAVIVGLLAAIVALAATYAVFGLIVQYSGITIAPRWLLFGVTGVALSLAVSAFRLAYQFALRHPRVRIEVGRLALFVAGAAALYGASELYFKWNSRGELRQAMVLAKTEIEKQLPKTIDKNTTLVAVRLENDTWTYVYNLKTASFDAEALQTQVRSNVCASNLRSWIAKGVSYRFEYWDSEVNLLGRLLVDSCP